MAHGQTDRWTHRPCSAYYVGCVNNFILCVALFYYTVLKPRVCTLCAIFIMNGFLLIDWLVKVRQWHWHSSRWRYRVKECHVTSLSHHSLSRSAAYTSGTDLPNYFMTILWLSLDNATYLIDLPRTSNLQNVLKSSVMRRKLKILSFFSIVFVWN